ncbi:MAG: acyl-CoA reductase [Clostridia bacterium]
MSKSQAFECLCGALEQPATPLRPFAEPVMTFLNELSIALLRCPESKGYPDVVTFAFFCRRANLEHMRVEYAGALDDRLGRGTVFHVAPSNVPINFAYSLAAALLAGNRSVVKASSKDFAQARIVCRAISTLLAGEYGALAPYVNVVMYPRELQELTERFSAACDIRVIWGGDETVRRVREAALAPRAFDVTFADRYSLLCVRAEKVLSMDEKELARAALGFYNDTYLTDQNACTSPRLVYWVGASEAVSRARARFWPAVHAAAAERYPIEPVLAVDKLTAACRAAIELEGAHKEPMPDNLTVCVSLRELCPGLEAHRCAGGFFLEYADERLDALEKIVDARYQTLTCMGFDPAELRAFVLEHGLRGIDRIVPVGHSMDFALTWDGYDLIRTLSRRVAC